MSELFIRVKAISIVRTGNDMYILLNTLCTFDLPFGMMGIYSFTYMKI